MPLIKANGINLYYELHGPVDAQTLVLNNGLIMNAATSWVFQTAGLSEKYHLLQYDCRGQGQSDHPDSQYSMDLHADDLAALLDILQIPQAHIAGISYGGEVAQAFALKYPQMIHSLILADTVSEVQKQLEIITHSWIDALRSGDALVFFNTSVPWNFSPQFIKNNQELLEDAKQRYTHLDFPAVIRLCECFLQVDFTANLHEIDVPSCIIVGGLDQLKGLEYANILHQGLPNSELHVLPGAGHAACWENPSQFNHIILGFLSKHKEHNM